MEKDIKTPSLPEEKSPQPAAENPETLLHLKVSPVKKWAAGIPAVLGRLVI
jgi:hypothetical protein